MPASSCIRRRYCLCENPAKMEAGSRGAMVESIVMVNFGSRQILLKGSRPTSQGSLVTLPWWQTLLQGRLAPSYRTFTWKMQAGAGQPRSPAQASGRWDRNITVGSNLGFPLDACIAVLKSNAPERAVGASL
jgi:hypothetical protein